MLIIAQMGLAGCRHVLHLHDLDSAKLKDLHEEALQKMDGMHGSAKSCESCIAEWEQSGLMERVVDTLRATDHSGRLIFFEEGGRREQPWGASYYVRTVVARGKTYYAIVARAQSSDDSLAVWAWEMSPSVKDQTTELLQEIRETSVDGILMGDRPIVNACCSILWDFSVTPAVPAIFTATTSASTDSLAARLDRLMRPSE